MRTAAIAFACLLAAAAAGEAAEPPLVPPFSSSFPPSMAKPRTAAPELHALLPDVKPPHGRNEGGRPPRGRICFSQSETREKIAAHRLSDPLHALRVGSLQGDALSARLCRWSADEFVYEIHVLRRDGRVLRVYMNAANGEAIGSPTGPDRTPDRRDRN